MSARSFWLLLATTLSLWSTLLLLVAIDGQGSITAYRVSGFVLLTLWWFLEFVTALDELRFASKNLILGVSLALTAILANAAITAAIVQVCCEITTHKLALIIVTGIADSLTAVTIINQELPEQPNKKQVVSSSPRRRAS